MNTSHRDVFKAWTIQDSMDCYNIMSWGLGYFGVSQKGEVTVRPGKAEGPEVSLIDIIRELKERYNMNPPVLLRFSDILCSRIRLINTAFRKAIRKLGYKNVYNGVYPIKVNQKRPVVADILKFGRYYHHGLEVGSKAELIAAISLINTPGGLIVCNGYKDREYIELALSSLMLGINTIIVIEMPTELQLITKIAKRLPIRPILGVRVKLSATGSGHWDFSAGDRGKFGLDTAGILDIVHKLKKNNMLDCLKMLHYHIGSQVPDIQKLRIAVREAARFYTELVRNGAPMGILNVGGGLAVDYDGSKTNFHSSANYTLDEYAMDILEAVMQTCDNENVPHPVIISESGRATVAHHSVLVINVLQVRQFESSSELPLIETNSHHELTQNLIEVYKSLSSKNYQESYHDALYYLDEIRTLFRSGVIKIEERAFAEQIFRCIMKRIANRIAYSAIEIPEELQDIEQAISDIYYANFSLFQSLPDSWAIDQLFPIMPLHRLKERPIRNAIIADISCDSDGKIDHFVDIHDIKRVLPLHELNGEDYYLGVFLVGAYQETLGDMHNLLGDVNVAHVKINNDGTFKFEEIISGDSVADVISYVEYRPYQVQKRFVKIVENAVSEKRITPRQSKKILRLLLDGLRGYTYLEK